MTIKEIRNINKIKNDDKKNQKNQNGDQKIKMTT